MQRILFNFYLALEGVMANRLRAILTALGIIFGVAAVIAMLAIGRGAEEAILEQMKLIGTNNIIVKSEFEDKEDEDDAEATTVANQKKKRPYSPGLTLEDIDAIEDILPTLSDASPEVVISTTIIQSGKLEKAKCIGITNSFFELNNIKLGAGKKFHDVHFERGKPVCIIGKKIQAKFFSQSDPIGQKIKCGNTWLTVIGVLEQRIATKESLTNLGIRDYNADVYIPITTALRRFKNRAIITKKDIKRGNRSGNQTASNYHQLDRLVLQVKDANQLAASAGIVSRILTRRHNGVVDFEIQVPEKQIEAQQKTQQTFNIVLAVIAGISLLVGGIGIMNIMLASVLERIKEIGVRRSLGANRKDIVLQFLFEAIFISLIGGLIGIFLGVFSANVIANSAEIPTIVSSWSIILSFGVAASIGLIFGIFPAQRAAQQDPIKALRTD